LACTWIYNGILIGAGLLLLNCSDLDRDNLLDPKNMASRTAQKIMIEAFVNINSNPDVPEPPPVNQFMIEALDSLQSMYADQIVIAEYHRTTGSQKEYTDAYHREENSILYQLYLNTLHSDQKGTPDVFFNGTEHRLRGASDKISAFSRLQEILLYQLSVNSSLSIEIGWTDNGNKIVPKITLARLGGTSIEDILVKCVLTTDFNADYLRRVVRKSNKSNIIPLLEVSEMMTVTLPEMDIDRNLENRLIAMITTEDETIILQTVSIEIPPTQ